MGNMILGSYTFEKNPTDMEPIDEQKYCAVQKTYSGVAVFDWGNSVAGIECNLFWKGKMSAAQYNAIKDIWLAGDIIVFDPQYGSGKTYNVKVFDFYGKLDTYLVYRKEVTLTLLILSEVA